MNLRQAAPDHDGHRAVRRADVPPVARRADIASSCSSRGRRASCTANSRPTSTRCAKWPAQRGLPIFEPESINTDAARAELARHQPDLFVVCDYGQILKPETLAIARLGGINLHASLLPKYRGAAPINWAVYHGETVNWRHRDPHDAGGRRRSGDRAGAPPIGPDDTAADLEPRLAELGAPLVARRHRRR